MLQINKVEKQVSFSQKSDNTYYQIFEDLSFSELKELHEKKLLNIHDIDNNGMNALGYAIIYKNEELISYLINQKVSTYQTPKNITPPFKSLLNIAFYINSSWSTLKLIIDEQKDRLIDSKELFDDIFNSVLYRDNVSEIEDLFDCCQKDLKNYKIYSHNIYTKAAYNSFNFLYDLIENKKLDPNKSWFERDENNTLIYLRAALNSHVKNTVNYYIHTLKIKEKEFLQDDSYLIFELPYFLSTSKYLDLLNVYPNLSHAKNEDNLLFIEYYAAFTGSNIERISKILKHPSYDFFNNKKGHKKILKNMLKRYYDYDKIKDFISFSNLTEKEVLKIFNQLDIKFKNDAQDFISTFEKEILEGKYDATPHAKRSIKKI